MRTAGVQPADDGPKSAARTLPRRSPRTRVALAVVVLLAAVGGYFVLGRRPSAGESHGPAPLSTSALSEALKAAGADAGELASLLAPDPAIERFAAQAAGSASKAFEKADAVQRAIRARASALAFIPWSLGEPRTSAVKTAAQLAPVLAKDKGRAELYPLELSAFAVAALRAQKVPALVVELHDLEGERSPLDPSGYLGYFAVAVYEDAPGVGAPKLYDPYGGRTLPPAAKHTLLRDPQAIGAALALRALHEVSYLADPRRGLESSSDALALAGTLPSVRTVRGMVVLAGKQVEQGLQEFAAARQLRSDAARLHNLATAELMTGDLERATKDLQAALTRAPDFAGARATLGAVQLIKGEPDDALRELRRAEELAPDLSLVQWALADYWLRTGDRERALTTARRALAQRASFDAQLRMGVLLRQAGQYDEMRALTAQLVERAPEYRKGELRELLREAFGPTAFDDLDAEPSPADEAEGDPARELSGSKLLAPKGDGLRLEAPSAPGAEDESRGSKLRLRDRDQQLELKLRP